MKDNNTKKGRSSFFSKETLGMTLMLFSAVSVLLLLLSKLLFGSEWFYTQFLYGALGYCSFAFFIILFSLGIVCVLDKKGSKHMWKKVALISLLFIFLACLVQVITSPDALGNFSEYVGDSYRRGMGGITTCTAGGALFAVISYLPLRYLTAIGCYILFPVLIAGDIFLLFRVSIVEAIKKAHGKSAFSDKDLDGTRPYPDADFDFGAMPDQLSNGKLYHGTGASEFSFVNKKGMKNDRDKSYDILYPGRRSEEPEPQDNEYGIPKFLNRQNSADNNGAETRNDERSDRRSGRNGYDNYTGDRSARRDDEYRSRGEERGRGEDFSSRGEKFTDRSRDESTGDRFDSRDARPESNGRDTSRFDTNGGRGFDSSYVDARDRRSGEFGRPASVSSFRSSDRSATARTERDDFFDGEEKPKKAERVDDNVFPGFIDETRGGVFENTGKDATETVDDTSPFADKWDNPIGKISEKERASTPKSKNRSVPADDAAEPVQETNVRKFDMSGEKKSVVIDPGTGEAVMPSDEGRSAPEPALAAGETVKPDEPLKYTGIPEMPLRYRYNAPPITLYNDNPKDFSTDDRVNERCRIIESTLADFGIPAEVKNVERGPTIMRFEISIPGGIPVSRVPPRANDLAMRLEVDAVRIEAPIPGKNLIGIEVPKPKRDSVGMKELLLEKEYSNASSNALAIVLGKDVVGNPVITDLTKTPHLLVAGATGMGKSVFLNVLIMSLVTKYGPDDLRIVLVDPKQVEFASYENLPHLLVKDIITEAPLCIGILDWAINEMEERYRIFRSNNVVKIDEYNSSINPRTQRKMPKIVILIDELGDLFSISQQTKHDIEERIKRLTQKARAAGIHVVLATQRPDVTVITGVIKANIPSRIAFKVLNYTDSKTILNDGGADQLLDKGDMLVKTANSAILKRVQGAFVAKDEMTKVLDYIKENNACYYDDNAQKFLDAKKASTATGGTGASISFGGGSGGSDEGEGDGSMFNNIPIRNIKALKIAVTKGQTSISMIQRSMSVGYATAGRIIDWMESMNYISANQGSKSREVFMTLDEFDSLYGDANID